jgi:two-component system, NarL family, sensor histidine kinase UhpB
MNARHWFRSALTTRLLAVALLPSLLLFTAMVLVLFQLARLDAESDVRERGRLTALAIAQSIQYDVASGNPDGLKRTLTRFLEHDPALVEIAITDTDGVTLSNVVSAQDATVLARFYAKIERDVPTLNLFDPKTIQSSITGKSAPSASVGTANASANPPNQLGSVSVSVQSAPLIAARTKRVVFALCVVGLTGLVCLGLGLALAQRVRQPFARVMNSLRDIREGRFTTAQLPVSSPGEMGELEKVVNAIAESMNRSHHQLEAEISVRTADLQKAQSALYESNRERGAVLARTNMMVEEERRKLSHEIHDRFNADLVAIKHAVERITERLQTHTVWFDTVATRYALIEDLERVDANISGVYGTARSIVKSLRPEILDTLGLEKALRGLLSQFESENPDCSFTLTTEPNLLALEGNIAITAYRVVQECLTNVVKHADATNVSVSAFHDVDKPYFTICVRDDGHGFKVEAPRQQDSLGLIAIRERAEGVNGRVRVTSSQAGTEVCLDLPAMEVSTHGSN